MIEYLYTEGKIGGRSTPIPVRFDGKRVGTIKPVEGTKKVINVHSRSGSSY